MSRVGTISAAFAAIGCLAGGLLLMAGRSADKPRILELLPLGPSAWCQANVGVSRCDGRLTLQAGGADRRCVLTNGAWRDEVAGQCKPDFEAQMFAGCDWNEPGCRKAIPGGSMRYVPDPGDYDYSDTPPALISMGYRNRIEISRGDRVSVLTVLTVERPGPGQDRERDDGSLDETWEHLGPGVNVPRLKFEAATDENEAYLFVQSPGGRWGRIDLSAPVGPKETVCEDGIVVIGGEVEAAQLLDVSRRCLNGG